MSSSARAGICIGTAVDCVVGTQLLDCPGPGCPAGAFKLFRAKVEVNGDALLVSDPFWKAGFECADLISRPSAQPRVVLIVRYRPEDDVLRPDDPDIARQVSYRVGRLTADRIRERCHFAEGQVIPVGLGLDEPLPGEPLKPGWATISFVADDRLFDQIRRLQDQLF